MLSYDGKVLLLEDVHLTLNYLAQVPEASEVIAVFTTNAGGSGTVDHRTLVVVRDGDARLVELPHARGPVAVRTTASRFELELGFSAGKKITVSLSDGKLAVKRDTVFGANLDEAHCKWLYETVMPSCAELPRGQCQLANVSEGLFVSRGMAHIADFPGFNRVGMERQCTRACRDRKVPARPRWQREVCGRR